MTKQVALAEKTYARLRRSRRPDESFSAAIERLLDGQRRDPLAFLDVPRSATAAAERREALEADREASWTDA